MSKGHCWVLVPSPAVKARNYISLSYCCLLLVISKLIPDTAVQDTPAQKTADSLVVPPYKNGTPGSTLTVPWYSQKSTTHKLSCEVRGTLEKRAKVKVRDAAAGR